MSDKKEPQEGDEFLTCEDGVPTTLIINEVNEETSEGQWTVADESDTIYTIEWDDGEDMWVDSDADFPQEDPDAETD